MEGLLYCSLSLCVVNIGQPTMPSWRLGRKLATVIPSLSHSLSALSLYSRTCWGLRKSVHLGQKLANFMYFFGCVFFRKSSYKCAASSSVSHVLPMRFDEYFAPQDAPDVRMTPRNRDSLDRKVARCYTTRGRKER